jgi:hypothetical protein
MKLYFYICILILYHGLSLSKFLNSHIVYNGKAHRLVLKNLDESMYIEKNEFEFKFDNYSFDKYHGIYFKVLEEKIKTNSIFVLFECEDDLCFLPYSSIFSIELKEIKEIHKPDLIQFELELNFIAEAKNMILQIMLILTKKESEEFNKFICEVKPKIEHKSKRMRR